MILVPKTPEDLFGRRACEAFPSTLIDLEEASRCLAANRHTASVFHLMRVLEVALRELGRSLNDPTLDPKTNPSWERILHRCDVELAKSFTQRCAEWQADPGFYSEATANLRAVKVAWRNPTMHIEID